MASQWADPIFRSIERYDLDVLVLGPGDLSEDGLMKKKRHDLMEALKRIKGVVPTFYTASNVADREKWLEQVRSHAEERADYVFCLISPSISIFAEIVAILTKVRNRMAVFYDSTEYESNPGIRTMIEYLRSKKIPLCGFDSKRIRLSHLIERAIGSIYTLLQQTQWR
jgi:hypothetical protein